MPSNSSIWTACPAGQWTTIFRGPLPFVGFFEIHADWASQNVGIEYSAWSISPIFSTSGKYDFIGNKRQFFIGPTGYAELKVKPINILLTEVANLRATGA